MVVFCLLFFIPPLISLIIRLFHMARLMCPFSFMLALRCAMDFYNWRRKREKSSKETKEKTREKNLRKRWKKNPIKSYKRSTSEYEHSIYFLLWSASMRCDVFGILSGSRFQHLSLLYFFCYWFLSMLFHIENNLNSDLWTRKGF